jgi:hypothetical protein
MKDTSQVKVDTRDHPSSQSGTGASTGVTDARGQAGWPLALAWSAWSQPRRGCLPRRRRLIGVLVALILAPALLGMLLAARLTPSARTSVVLNVSMRDFAMASGIAAAVFGPAAAAPLASYGVLVMAWGALVARPAGRPRSSGPDRHRRSRHHRPRAVGAGNFDKVRSGNMATVPV